MRVETVGTVQELARCHAQWAHLHRRVANADVFSGPGWIGAWLATFWRDRPVHFQLLWEGDTLVAVVPLVIDDAGELWCRGSLVTPVDAHTTRCDLLSAIPIDDVLAAVLPALREAQPARTIVLKRIPDASVTFGALRHGAVALRLRAQVQPEFASRTLALDGGWDAWLARLPKHARSELLRKRRVLERAGSAELRVVTETADVDAALAAVLEIEAASWKDAAGTSLRTEHGSDAFYSAVVRERAAAGALRLFLLLLDGQPIAHAICSVERHALYALKTSYRQDRASLSPGAVIISHVIEDACRHGQPLLDLLGADQRWKRELADGTVPASTVCLFPPRRARCQLCRIEERRIKPFVRTHAGFLLDLRRRLRTPTTTG